MKTFKSFLHENKRRDIANLQPDTRVEVFHGTTQEVMYQFLEYGIDARKPIGRQYPHAGNRNFRGLFVSPDYETAYRFGRAVLKFTVLGKDLYPMFPDREKLRNPDSYISSLYPNSFRPEVSYDMLERGKGSESQAIFVGTVSPKQISKIWINGKESSPTHLKTHFIDPSKPFSLENLISHIENKYNLSRQEIIKLLKTNDLDDLGLNIPYTVQQRLRREIARL